MNDLESFRDVFRGITPYAGTPPKGFLVDFLGTLVDSRFRVGFNGNPETDGGKPVKGGSKPPTGWRPPAPRVAAMS
jgi:hypothetical protein